MKIHAAHLTGPPDGPVALLVPEVPDRDCAKAWPEHVIGDYDPRCCRFPKSCSAYPVPHPDWVAAAQPCPTCGGDPVGAIRSDCQRHFCYDGLIYEGDAADGTKLTSECGSCHVDDCADCIGGKPKVELTYPCLTCAAHRARTGRDEYLHSENGRCINGEVSAGVGTITLVPVVAVHDLAWWANELTEGEVRRVIQTNGDITSLIEYTNHSGESIGPVNLPPGVKPGDTVAIWTAAEEPS